MTNLFERALVFTDIHFGKKNNDRQHNIDCENFCKWLVNKKDEYQADCLIFMGDWHDNRHSIHVSTLNYSHSNMQRLSDKFEKFYFIPGNHDIYHKEKREITSVIGGSNFNNITIINDFLETGNVTFCPWLVGDEWKKIPEYAKKSDYMFGHFELPHFMMNALVEMPDHGELNVDHFDGVKYLAFSGHFHKRQMRKKVCYIGNPFAHTFADAWDDERGAMFLEWGKAPVFINWEDGPRYKTPKLSELLSNIKMITDKSFLKVSCDLDITTDEIQTIKEILNIQYSPRKLDINQQSKDNVELILEENEHIKSIDQIVIEGLSNLDLSKSIDKNTLISIFRGL